MSVCMKAEVEEEEEVQMLKRPPRKGWERSEVMVEVLGEMNPEKVKGKAGEGDEEVVMEGEESNEGGEKDDFFGDLDDEALSSFPMDLVDTEAVSSFDKWWPYSEETALEPE
ncbi:hypothetical protein IE53DRAFT_408254 [Violaceomyces palustris]|uniref:Uncharacterized protein n=1 Tax=Violaceomyces palustris TaxID=1673888 RepID=A0ACD0P7L2_9BASI|nr:hypothetical protein IE53DRAFT_408254 [Violaceomyces palustris]